MGEPCKNQRHPRTMITALRWLASSATTEQANSQFVICRVPCLTLRENTERPVTVTEGTNTIVGNDPGRIVKEAMAMLRDQTRREGRPGGSQSCALRRAQDGHPCAVLLADVPGFNVTGVQRRSLRLRSGQAERSG